MNRNEMNEQNAAIVAGVLLGASQLALDRGLPSELLSKINAAIIAVDRYAHRCKMAAVNDDT